MDFEEMLQILNSRYGQNGVDVPTGADNIHVHVPVQGSELLFTAILTVAQARFLAMNPISGGDLKNGRFPQDWPQSIGVSG